MSDQKKKRDTFTTPKGLAVYPYLTKPDSRTIKDKPQRPAFKIKLKIADADDIEKLKAIIDPAVEASYKAALADAKPADKKKIERAYPYGAETDDQGNETGAVIFNFKQNAEITKKNGEVIRVTIPLFDAKGKPIKGVSPAGGSVVKAAFSMRPYMVDSTKKAGVSLDLSAVQVLELKLWEGRSSESYGFGKEDGFDADESAEQSNDETSEDGDADTSPAGSSSADESDF